MTGKTKLTYIITSLNMGGAEMMLCRLLEHIDRDRFEAQVVSLIPIGVVGEKIRALGIPVRSLDMDPARLSLRAFSELVRLLHQERPDIIHTWMYHADLLGGLAGFLTGIPVIWGIHNTSLEPAFVKSSTIRVVHLNARLSNWIPQRVVVCSDEARNQHIKLGYTPEKFVTIPNGFDLDIFHPDAAARFSLRKEIGLDPDVFLIGLVARFDPLKDHQTFTKAAGLFLGRYSQAHFLLCGRNISWENETLRMWISAAGPQSNFHLLGHRDNIPRIMNGLDSNTLSSIGEAFPNVLGEAMACGVPCVTTDVGDAAEIVGDTGIVVPPRDAHALADGWEQILQLTVQERARLGKRARERIRSRYEIQQIAKQYESLYLEVARIK